MTGRDPLVDLLFMAGSLAALILILAWAIAGSLA